MKIFALEVLLATVVSCAGSATPQMAQSAPKVAPTRYEYTVKQTYPHLDNHYTQGLLWLNDALYESTGEYGKSGLFVMNLEEGTPLKSVNLDRQYFGEGLAELGGSLYQLTWLENTGFVYDAATLAPKGTFAYDGEGWGLTSDGKYLYMSDGSQIIKVIDPEGWKTVRNIYVKFGQGYQKSINELEWIDGKIWANLYGYNRIIVINPDNGNTEGYIDLDKLSQTQTRNARADVLNGIAYDKASGRIFVTGKNWDKLFVIEIKATK